MRATVPVCSGATPESTENLTTAWPFEPSPMDRTDPTWAGPISTRLPGTSPPASWKSAVTV